MKARILASVLRETVGHLSAVGRSFPPVERKMRISGIERSRVDEQADTAVFLDEELEVVRPGRALLEKHPAPGSLDRGWQRYVARELLNAIEQRVPPWQGVENRARMVVLAFEEGQPVGVLLILHPAVGIRHRLAE